MRLVAEQHGDELISRHGAIAFPVRLISASRNGIAAIDICRTSMSKDGIAEGVRSHTH